MIQDWNIRFESARVLVMSVESCLTPCLRMLLTLTGARIRPYAQLLRWILLIILDFVVKSVSYCNQDIESKALSPPQSTQDMIALGESYFHFAGSLMALLYLRGFTDGVPGNGGHLPMLVECF